MKKRLCFITLSILLTVSAMASKDCHKQAKDIIKHMVNTQFSESFKTEDMSVGELTAYEWVVSTNSSNKNKSSYSYIVRVEPDNRCEIYSMMVADGHDEPKVTECFERN